jgi:hypothetical protein
MDPRGYKGGKPHQQSRRAQLIEELIARSASFLALDGEQRALLAASDHLLDALVCSLIARAAFIGATLPIPDNVRALALVEGWIALPRADSLPELAGRPASAGRS